MVRCGRRFHRGIITHPVAEHRMSNSENSRDVRARLEPGPPAWWLLFKLCSLFPVAIVLSALVGLIGGVGSIVFVSLVNSALQSNSGAPRSLLTRYLLLSGFLLVNYAFSQALGSKFAQITARTLRRRLI